MSYTFHEFYFTDFIQVWYQINCNIRLYCFVIFSKRSEKFLSENKSFKISLPVEQKQSYKSSRFCYVRGRHQRTGLRRLQIVLMVCLMRPYGSKPKSAARWAISVVGQWSGVSANTIVPLKPPSYV